MGSDKFWAITSYFNPIGYKNRLKNYRFFRQRLAMPLVAVELSFGGGFQLQPGDADALIQVHDGDVLWQKERLLNIALAAVPDECDKIAWLDSDVLFEDSDWVERAGRLLEQFALVQLFESRYDLPPNSLPEHVGKLSDSSLAVTGLLHVVEQGTVPDNDEHQLWAFLEGRRRRTDDVQRTLAPFEFGGVQHDDVCAVEIKFTKQFWTSRCRAEPPQIYVIRNCTDILKAETLQTCGEVVCHCNDSVCSTEGLQPLAA